MIESTDVKERLMSPDSLGRMLEVLKSSSGSFSSCYSSSLNGAAVVHCPPPLDLPDAVQKAVQNSRAGHAVFAGSSGERVLVIPPFPVEKSLFADYLETAPLLEVFKRQYRIGIVLIRLGSFAFGISRGQILVASKVGKGLVHGRHRKGGSSSNRFARHREKQTETFFSRACNYLQQYFEPHLKEIDFCLYGGARTTVQEFKKQCRFTEMLVMPELPSLFDLPDPRQAVLYQAIERIWSSKVFTWNDEPHDLPDI
jgi:hypothetical protein